MKQRRNKKKKITGKMKSQYYQYLRSPQWREKRQMAFDIYGKTCSLCGSKHDLEIHHRHYKNIYKEKIEDLMVLCESCHRLYHKKQIWRNGKESKYMRNPKYETAPTTFYPDRRASIPIH